MVRAGARFSNHLFIYLMAAHATQHTYWRHVKVVRARQTRMYQGLQPDAHK